MTCEGCGCFFCPDTYDHDPAQRDTVLHCSRQCRKRAHNRRARQRKALRLLCEQRGKLRYPTADAARRDARVLKAQAGLPPMREYPCQDHFHLTSMV